MANEEHLVQLKQGVAAWNTWRDKKRSIQPDLHRAILIGADFHGVTLYRARLDGADLTYTRFINTDLRNANLTGCRIYGISAWGLQLVGTIQSNLIITQPDEATITVDNLEVAQFIYLLLHNEKIREVIDTIGKKGILILGRFTPERKAVLDALRTELRKRDFIPMIFDFEKPTQGDARP